MLESLIKAIRREKWHPSGSAEYYRKYVFELGQKIATHIVETHGGVRASSCHKCIALHGKWEDGKYFLAAAEEYEKGQSTTHK